MTCRIVQILMERDGCLQQEAVECVHDAAALVTQEDYDAEEVLMDELGLEPDYIIDFLEYLK